MLMLGVTGGALLGPLISGILMEAYHPWIPIYIAAATSPLVLIAMLFLPETLQRKATSTHTPSQTLTEWVSAQITESLSQARAATSLLRTRSVALVLATFLIYNPVNTAHSFTLVQYISQQFGWDIAQTSFLLSPLGVLNVAVLAGLPVVADALTSPSGRFKLSPFRKDAVLTRLSLLFIVVACLIEGLSRSVSPFIFGLVVGTFGSAASPLTRALLTHYVDSRFTSRLMALISIVETMGSFLGGPVIAMFFQLGQERGGSLTGLPFLYVGALAAGAFVCLLYIRAPGKQVDEGEAVDLAEPFADETGREAAYSDEPDAPLLLASDRA
ncbi:MFS transporter [Candidatus Bathyarchaeota archaeon]|nr:MFS transporter [Candidatus Bathyarchaeota archaeon]